MTVKVKNRARKKTSNRSATSISRQLLLHDLGRGIRLLRQRWADRPDAPPIFNSNPDFIGTVSTPGIVAPVVDGGRPPQHWGVTVVNEFTAHVQEISGEDHEAYLRDRFRRRHHRLYLDRVRRQARRVEARRRRQYADHPRSLRQARSVRAQLSPPPVLPVPVLVLVVVLALVLGLVLVVVLVGLFLLPCRPRRDLVPRRLRVPARPAEGGDVHRGLAIAPRSAPIRRRSAPTKRKASRCA